MKKRIETIGLGSVQNPVPVGTSPFLYEELTRFDNEEPYFLDTLLDEYKNALVTEKIKFMGSLKRSTVILSCILEQDLDGTVGANYIYNNIEWLSYQKHKDTEFIVLMKILEELFNSLSGYRNKDIFLKRVFEHKEIIEDKKKNFLLNYIGYSAKEIKTDVEEKIQTATVPVAENKIPEKIPVPENIVKENLWERIKRWINER